MSEIKLPVPQTMPRYVCHKEVQALKIKAVILMGPNYCQLKFDNDTSLAVKMEWFDEHVPKTGGYYVVYGDGYASYSHPKAFESGYSLIDTDSKNLVFAQFKATQDLSVMDLSLMFMRSKSIIKDWLKDGAPASVNFTALIANQLAERGKRLGMGDTDIQYFEKEKENILKAAQAKLDNCKKDGCPYSGFKAEVIPVTSPANKKLNSAIVRKAIDNGAVGFGLAPLKIESPTLNDIPPYTIEPPESVGNADDDPFEIEKLKSDIEEMKKNRITDRHELGE